MHCHFLASSLNSFVLLSTCFFLLHVVDQGTAFSTHPLSTSTTTKTSSETSFSALFMGTSRQTKRKQSKEKQRKNRRLLEALKEDDDDDDDDKNKISKSNNRTVSPPSPIGGDTESAVAASGGPPDDDERKKRMDEAQKRMDKRPDVTTMIVDEETGMEIIAQGKNVMDVVTRKAVKLSELGSEYRLAQLFPGVPPQIREQHRLDIKTVEVPEMVEALRAACSVKLPDGNVGIPTHPSVANKGIDFVLANRDLLGYRMSKTLGRLMMRSMWKGNVQEAREYRRLWKNFLTLENLISAPLRQMIMDAEGRVGPNFGNLDMMSFCNGELYERVANYLVLQGMVSHWEKKVVDADFVERNPQTKENFISILARGDPKRYLPDPPILFTLRECTQVCARAQQMRNEFVESEELFGDFPPEIRFLQKALSIQGGTPLRKFMIEEFCPAEEISPEALREGMRRLHQQLYNLQIDPYGDLTNVLEKLMIALAVGTEEERDPYIPYLANPSPQGPGYFQTYTFNAKKQSLVRFLDAQYERDGQNEMELPPIGIPNFFNFGEDEEKDQGGGFNPNYGDRLSDEGGVYKVPQARAVGRPHELGWLDLLDDEKKDKNMRLSTIRPGRIIPDDE